METIGFLWTEAIVRPMLNSLVFLYVYLFHNFAVSIVVFTVLVRIVTFPLTLRQIKQTRAMAELQPKLKELQERYPKDRQKVSQETMRLYKEHGINPIGCLGPMIIQFPIWIGLYQAIIQTLSTTPESLAGLSRHLYTWLPTVHKAVPLSSHFLWLDLALPDRTPLLPVLVGASMWVQQKMSTPPSADPRQASTNNMMLWMMPFMFAFFTFQFPSGLAIYWVVSNAIGIGIQYTVTGWGPLFSTQKSKDMPVQAPQPAKETDDHGQSRSDSKDSGRSAGVGPKAARRKSRRGGGNRS